MTKEQELQEEEPRQHGQDAGTSETAASPEGEAPAPEQEEPLARQLLRLQADFENFRKRVARERAEWFARANEDLLLEVLPSLDHYEMGLQKARENHQAHSVVDGFQMIYQQLIGTLGKFGLKAISLQNDPFDPHLHEAVTHLPSETIPADHIIEQTRRGYLLGDKLLRPAQVVVSSGPAGQQTKET